MKQFIILLIALFLSFPAFAQMSAVGNAYNTVETKVTKIINPKKDVCPVYADTPRELIQRPDFEIDFRMGILDSPSGGSYAVRTDNYDLELKHNLSSTLYAYIWYGVRAADKAKVYGSAYDPKWSSQMIFGGIGVYVMPTVAVFAGGGKIFLKNENGEEPDLDVAVERGISVDVPIGKNKIVLGYRFIDAKLKGQDSKDISKIQGDGSFSVVSISFSVPLNWGD